MTLCSKVRKPKLIIVTWEFVDVEIPADSDSGRLVFVGEVEVDDAEHFQRERLIGDRGQVEAEATRRSAVDSFESDSAAVDQDAAGIVVFGLTAEGSVSERRVGDLFQRNRLTHGDLDEVVKIRR